MGETIAERELERLVRLTPAWDKTDPDPIKNYGVHSVEMHLILRGEPGAIAFVLYTGWMLPHVHAEYAAQRLPIYQRPLPAELNYHSRAPRFPGSDKHSPACDCMNNAPCWCGNLGDGHTVNRVFETLVREGDEAAWELLRERYEAVFGKEQTL